MFMEVHMSDVRLTDWTSDIPVKAFALVTSYLEATMVFSACLVGRMYVGSSLSTNPLNPSLSTT